MDSGTASGGCAAATHGADMDDAKTLLAVYRGGSLEAAAEILGLNFTTVYRRLARMEARSGGALFDRQGSTYVLNDRGRLLLDPAVRLEQEMAVFQRELTARTSDLEGQLRLTLPPSLLGLLRFDIATFRQGNPKVSVWVDAGLELVDLVRRDADLAVRCTEAPDPRIVGRRVAELAWAAYSRVDADPNRLPWVGYASSTRRAPAVLYHRKTWPDVVEAFRVESAVTMLQVLGASDVVGYVPCHLGDLEPGLKRLSEPRKHSAVWVLYAAELRRSRPVLALADRLIDGLSRYRGLLEGEGADEGVAALLR